MNRSPSCPAAGVVILAALGAVLLPDPGRAQSAHRPAPPDLIETRPAFWEVGVNPGRVRRISLTFDQRMRPGTTAWLGRSSVLPELQMDDEISPDLRTFHLQVQLQPGRVYVFALNEKQVPGVGFQSERGVPWPRHYLVCQTAGTPAPGDAPPTLTRTAPANGEAEVDPSTVRAIELTFDKPMRTRTHGVLLFEADRPVDLTGTRFTWSDDGRTFRLSHPLRPGTEYRVQLNSTRNIGFATVHRIATPLA